MSYIYKISYAVYYIGKSTFASMVEKNYKKHIFRAR